MDFFFKINCCMFNLSFLCHPDGKYCSVTKPLVQLFSVLSKSLQNAVFRLQSCLFLERIVHKRQHSRAIDLIHYSMHRREAMLNIHLPQKRGIASTKCRRTNNAYLILYLKFYKMLPKNHLFKRKPNNWDSNYALDGRNPTGNL